LLTGTLVEAIFEEYNLKFEEAEFDEVSNCFLKLIET